MIHDDCDVTQPPVPSRLYPLDRLDLSSQRYDATDCDSWQVPGQRSTGPCDPAWKGEYDRWGCWGHLAGPDARDSDPEDG